MRRKLRLPAVKVPARLDAILRYGRFVILAVILYATVASLKLWFAEYDPYRTLFSLHWLFEFNLATMWPGLTILGLVTIASLLIERAWCKYLCPLGGVLTVLQHLSFLRIRREADELQGVRAVRPALPHGDQRGRGQPRGERGLHRLPGVRGRVPEAGRADGAACAGVAGWDQTAGERVDGETRR